MSGPIQRAGQATCESVTHKNALQVEKSNQPAKNRKKVESRPSFVPEDKPSYLTSWTFLYDSISVKYIALRFSMMQAILMSVLPVFESDRVPHTRKAARKYAESEPLGRPANCVPIPAAPDLTGFEALNSECGRNRPVGRPRSVSTCPATAGRTVWIGIVTCRLYGG